MPHAAGAEAGRQSAGQHQWIAGPEELEVMQVCFMLYCTKHAVVLTTSIG